MRTLYLLLSGRYADRGVVGIYPTRAAAEAFIVARVLEGLDNDLLADGAEIIPMTLDDDEQARTAAAVADLWATVTPDVRHAVDIACGGLVKLLDQLVNADADATSAAARGDDFDALRMKLAGR